MTEHRRYTYVGHTGTRIQDLAELRAWLRRYRDDIDDRGILVATFVIAPDGVLVLAHRRFEHVKCAGATEVLSAGEMGFRGEEVVAVSNQSTGYCPEPASWPAVAAALDHAGIAHPDRFTDPIVFRRCPDPTCAQINIVKDDWYVCETCAGELPAAWNFDSCRP